MQGIYLVFSDAPTLIMTTPTVFPNYIINNDIEGNKSGVEILNNTTVGIHCTQAMQTKCTKNNSNNQRPLEILNQGCGCWGASGTGITNFYPLHTVVVGYRTSRLTMSKFLPNKFNLDIFQDTYFPQTVSVIALEHTDASDNPEYAIENSVDFINNHGGYTVVMWYSRKEINDKSLIGMVT